MLLLTVSDLARLVKKVGIVQFNEQLLAYLREDFSRWDAFTKVPRPASHFPNGVIEVMPIHDSKLYAYKYVNGHPSNPAVGKPCVIAVGQLSSCATGEPLMIAEMTILTAFRTAATSALAGSYLCPPGADTMAFIGTGAQAEFQAIALQCAMPTLRRVRYFDIDSKAMDKFARNMSGHPLALVPCNSIDECIRGAQLISTMTAAKARAVILTSAQISGGVHINALGGDCPGKTELEPALVQRAKVVVEFTAQTLIEGEVQVLGPNAIFAELHEIVRGIKPGRASADEITIFDSVGFALEDFSVLRLVYDLARAQQIGGSVDLIPDLADPKDLFAALG